MAPKQGFPSFQENQVICFVWKWYKKKVFPDPLTFCENCMPKKNVVLKFSMLFANEISVVFNQYLINGLAFDFDYLITYRYSHANYIITNISLQHAEIFPFIAVLAFKLLSRKVLFYKQKRQQKLLKSRLFFKIANFAGKLLQNYKQVECEIFRII